MKSTKPNKRKAAVEAPSDGPSLLAWHQARLVSLHEQIAAGEASGALPRDLAALRAGENASLREVKQLTGAVELTEAKILTSKAWRSIYDVIVQVLAKHPQAIADLKAHLEPLL